MQNLFGTLLQPVSPGECQVLPNCTIQIGDDGRIVQVTPLTVMCWATSAAG